MKINLLKRKLAAKQRALLRSGKRCSQEEILEESLEKLQEAWTNEGLDAAQGFLETTNSSCRSWRRVLRRVEWT